MRRHRLLLSSCALQDGYARLLKGEALLHNREGFDTETNESLKRRCIEDPSLSPRCGLCLSSFFVAESGGDRSPTSPSCCHHDYCKDCIMSWCEHVGNSCPVCGCYFMALIDSLAGKVVHSVASDCVTTSGTAFECDSFFCEEAETQDDSSISSCDDEDDRSEEDADDDAPHTSRLLANSVVSILADLDSSYPQAAASVSRSPVADDSDPPGALLRALFAEITRNRRCDVDLVDQILVELPSLLSCDEMSLCAKNLLDAGLLGTLRLLLSPSRVSSPVRNFAIQVGDVERHIVDPSRFLKSINILDRVTSLCLQGGKDKEVLTWCKFRESFGLPKLLLWYLSFNPFNVSTHHKAIDRTRQILVLWSKRFGFSLVDAVLQKDAKAGPGVRKSSPKPKVGRSPRKATTVPPLLTSKKRKQAMRTSSSGDVRPQGKRTRRVISATVKRSVVGVSEEQTQFGSSVKRAVGKRKVRPVNSFSVSVW